MPKLPDPTAASADRVSFQPSRSLASYQVPESRAGQITEAAGGNLDRAGGRTSLAASYMGDAAESLGGAQRTFGAVSDLIYRRAQEEKRQNDELRVEDAVNRAKQAAIDLEGGERGFGRLAGQAAIGAEVRTTYQERLQKAVEAISDGLDNDEQRKRFALMATPVKQRFEGQLLSHIASQRDRYAKDVLDNTVALETADAMVNYANPAAFDASMARIRNAIGAEAERAGWSPERVAATEAKVESEIHLGVIDRLLANRQDAAAQQYYERTKDQLRPDIATKVEASLSVWRERRESEAAASAKAANEAATSDIEIAVRRGRAGYAEIERAYDAGILTPAKRTQLTTYLDDEQRKAAERARKETDALQVVRTALNGGRFLDYRSEKDRDAVDLYFERAIAPGLAGADPMKRLQTIADFSARTGVVPRVVQGQIRGSLRAGTDADKVAAADLLGRLKAANPAVVDSFSTEDIALGNAIQTYVAAGMSAQQAAARAQQLQAAPKPELEAREVRYRQEKAPDKNQKWLADQVTGMRMLSPNLPAKVPDAMAGEFERLTRDEFLRSGDLDVARQTAADQMRRVWGVTSVDAKGERRWMKYAPESVYSVPGADASWIRNQFISEVRRSGFMAPDADFTIAADSVTAREQRPSYPILVRRDGVLEPAIGRDGRPLRFRPDFDSSTAGEERRAQLKAQEQENARILEQERLRRRERGRPSLGGR